MLEQQPIVLSIAFSEIVSISYKVVSYLGDFTVHEPYLNSRINFNCSMTVTSKSFIGCSANYGVHSDKICLNTPLYRPNNVEFYNSQTF